MTQATIFACSHRRGGNTDRAADLLREGVIATGGDAEVVYLRNHEVMHCLACGFCDEATGREGAQRCVLGEKDEAWSLFELLFTSRTVFFTSPIYFYHLPSMFKTWIDRSQQFWTARANNEPWLASLPERTAHAVLVAGRPTGDTLFEGAARTLRYFVKNFNLTLADPLVFRGIDERADLAGNAGFETRIRELGTTAYSQDR